MILLPPDYYLDNFKQLLQGVETCYRDLLADHELAFIRTFENLDHASQCLLVRLIGRKGPYFRRSRLNYLEIPDIDGAAECLSDTGLLRPDPTLSAADAARLLTKPELFVHFGDCLAGCRSLRKDGLIERLQTTYIQHHPWSFWTSGRDQLYQLDLDELIRVFLLLYFGNCYQDLTEFVLQDLGVVRFESYVVDPAHRQFQCRRDLLDYLQLAGLDEALALVEEPADLKPIAQQLPATSTNEKVERLRAKLCLRLGQAYERMQDWSTALDFYTRCETPPARERRVRMLEKLDDCAGAWIELQQLLTSPLNEQERQVAARMAPRIARKAKQCFAKPAPKALPETRLSLSSIQREPDNAQCIELAVLTHWHSVEEPCYYVENSLFNGLLGVWLWPEMFRSVPGAFANPFQFAPLDFYHGSFLDNRGDIAALWQQLDSGEYRSVMTETWRCKFGIANALVNWQCLDEVLLKLSLDCIPNRHLKAIFTRQLFDLRSNRSGFPDLIQFYPAQRHYRLIEVKAPGDRLQDNQRRWLEYFAQHHIPASVCYVS